QQRKDVVGNPRLLRREGGEKGDGGACSRCRRNRGRGGGANRRPARQAVQRGQRLPGRFVPAVVQGLLQGAVAQVAGQGGGGQDRFEVAGEVLRVVRVDENPRPLDQLDLGGVVARQDGRAAQHGLQQRQAEALVLRRQGEGGTALVEQPQVLVG